MVVTNQPGQTAELLSHAAGMDGTVGRLEILGELVFSTDGEKVRLDAGSVDYSTVAQILAAVEAPGVREFLRMI